MRVARSKPERRFCDGVQFDSIIEMERYQALKMLQRCGDIRNLQCHVKFDLCVNEQHICYYTADMTFIDAKTNETHVIDVKGFRKSPKTGKLLPRVNREFGLKCKLMLAVFGIRVEVV